MKEPIGWLKALDKTHEQAQCGLKSDTPVGQGGTLTLDTKTFAIIGAAASMSVKTTPPPGVPPPPDYLPEMEDELIVKNTVKALSPRVVAVHGPTTGDHSPVEERIPHCQQLVMKGVMHHVKRCFLDQPLDQSHNLLNQMAQIVIAFHNERVGRPLVDETCQSSGVNESNKFMVFVPGLAQIYPFCEILQRAIDLGWTEMLIPLPFHGQSPPEDVKAVFADPSVLAATNRYPLGQNPSLFAAESFETFSAPSEFQELWMAHREPRFARSCIVCTNVPESGITIPNVGIVISSGVQRRVSTDVRTGATVNALQTLSKAQLLQQLGRSGRTDCGIHITMMSRRQYLSQVRSADLAQLEESDISPMILRSLVAGRSFSRLPFLCPPHPMVQTHAKERMFLHGILDTRGVTRIGHATACMDLPCEWAQFLYTCAEQDLRIAHSF